jgi:thiol:disulfide interchange protein
MTNRKTGMPALIGVFTYSIVGVLLAETIYLSASVVTSAAIPIVVLGLSVLAGGTWFFVQWSTNRVEKAWPRIGAE